MKANLWTTENGGMNVDMAFVNNFSATAAPTANDDSGDGYQIGSTWVDTTTKIVYTCVDATLGAAVWNATGDTSPTQGAPTAKTVSSTMTAAQVLAGIITVTQGAGAASAQQMPTGTALQAALPSDFAVNDYFDFSVINLGGADEIASITVNTGVTIVGNAVIPVPATGVQSSALFRARKTAANTFVVYRIA